MNITTWVLFACALLMAGMGITRYRAGQKGLALRDFFMAAAMAVFGAGYL
ncbi:MAG: hypothetical protein LBD04_00015 [Synergistaceae bacterium]|jgi:hypothetical protein|nr:hypothetical protein [Synergistaceae bacterium]